MPNFTEPKDWRHHTAWIDTEARLHYVEVTPNEPNDMAIVLIHGYPETWYAFRHIMQPLADSGFRVIAVDYRGAGDSNHPAGGYDKKTMARDIFTLYHDKLGIEKAIIFGYDIGSMVAVSLAMQYEDHAQALISCEAPIPGTTAFEHITNDHSTKWSRVFHYFFHSCPDLPEALTQGRERMYLKHFYERLCYDPSFMTLEDENTYVSRFERVGAMRAGFEVYRAYRTDIANLHQQLAEKGRIRVPVLAMAGEHSLFATFIEDMTREIAEDVTVFLVPGCNHWLPEENPEGVLAQLQSFLGKRGLAGIAN